MSDDYHFLMITVLYLESTWWVFSGYRVLKERQRMIHAIACIAQLNIEDFEGEGGAVVKEAMDEYKAVSFYQHLFCRFMFGDARRKLYTQRIWELHDIARDEYK